jgi:hypothetical protein
MPTGSCNKLLSGRWGQEKSAMINAILTGGYAGPILQNYQRQRTRLALALFDVENAHAHLKKMDPNDHCGGQQLERLNAALEAYWRIDEQTEKYLQRAQGN